MRETILFLMLLPALWAAAGQHQPGSQETWPDGTVMDAWFMDTRKTDPSSLGRRYMLTDYGVTAGSPLVQTSLIQAVIDRCAEEGGGVVTVPTGTFLSGALFFPQGVHLMLCEGATLKGSDRIIDFPVVTTRIEGETCRYFPALINADGVDGFTICGRGTIDGNGLQYWQEFRIRRLWNPQCTNKDAQRPRLTYISNSRNVTIQDVHLINSPFWTNHVYRSHHVRFLDCFIYAPTEGIFPPQPEVGAPSSDAIDLDVCTDVLIDGCYMHVCDDAVVLKGGKGTWADQDPDNGANERILIQNCRYGRVFGCLVLGSESVHDRNIILRNCHSEKADRILWLKLRPDTPQHYEYIRVEDITGWCERFLYVHPWTQFYNKGDRKDMPLSRCHDVEMSNNSVECGIQRTDVVTSDKYVLSGFRTDGEVMTFE